MNNGLGDDWVNDLLVSTDEEAGVVSTQLERYRELVDEKTCPERRDRTPKGRNSDRNRGK